MGQRLQSSQSPVVNEPSSLDSPYLTTDEARRYLKFNSRQTLYWHIKQNGLPVLRAGSALRFDRRELDAWLRQELHLLPSKRTVAR